MKILSFLKWKFKQITFDDACWYIGSMLLGMWVATDFNRAYLIASVSFWMIIFVRILINSYRCEYQRYKEEQNQLFETIKHSDQK